MSDNDINSKRIHVMLDENRKFEPSDDFKKNANFNDPKIYDDAAKDPEKFWEECAEGIDWFQKWDKTLEWNSPEVKWFSGGKLNASYNCLDRHIKNGLKDKTAILWEGEPGDKRSFTYQELHDEVNKFASALHSHGITRGDRVAIYLPMIPELAIAMLACARIGAIHSVVFAGFSPDSLRDRIKDAYAKVLITADGGYRRGNTIKLKDLADEAVEGTHSIQHVIVVQRTKEKVTMKEGRDLWYHEIMEVAGKTFEPEPMEAEDLLFILYTSGTTGKPKGIMHSTGGYMVSVHTTTKYVFDLKPDDIYWCAADMGWITGHSYIVYGPLSNGATVLMYEGAPDSPDRGRIWKLIQDYKVNIFYTAPTAIRAFMKWGESWLEKYDLSSLRLLGTVGEPINPEAWMWYHKHVGNEKCPIVDTWWQTETGAIMITPLPGITATKPGSATKAFPGIDIDVVDEDGNTIEEGGGLLVIKKPWPSMIRGIYNDPMRYMDTYWKKFNYKLYFAGDGAKRDKDGYIWLLGRVDDVLNVAGHRLSTMEIESALVDHEAVAESAVVGAEHDIKGLCVKAFVTLREDVEFDDGIYDELKDHVSKKIGKIARPEDIILTAELPKTRSGKIMRRLLKDIANGNVLGDTSTLADPSVVERLKKQYSE